MAIQYIGNTISGVASDTKPTLTANEKGVIFVETDTNKIYQWDTDSWNITTATDATASAKGVASFDSGDFSVSSGAVSLADNITIAGNLTVSGTTNTVNATNLLIEDPLLVLAKDQSGSPVWDAGFIVERGSSNNVALLWDESADKFVFAYTTDTGTTAGNVSMISYAHFAAKDIHVDGDLIVDETSTFTGTATFASNVTIGANLIVGDNEKIYLGDSNDVEFYHDGSNSILLDNGTGNLLIGTNGSEVRITKGVGSEFMGRFVIDGGNYFYYDNNLKLETTSTGAAVTGTLTTTADVTVGDDLLLTDGKFVRWGGGSGDTRIYGSAANDLITFVTAGTERVRIDGSGNVGIGTTPSTPFHVVGNTTIAGNTYFGSQGSNYDVVFYGSTSGQNAVWDASDKSLEFADAASAKFGTGGDMKIWHNSNVNRIDSTNLIQFTNSSSNTVAKFISGTADAYVHILDSDSNTDYPPGIYADGDDLYLRGGSDANGWQKGIMLDDNGFIRLKGHTALGNNYLYDIGHANSEWINTGIKIASATSSTWLSMGVPLPGSGTTSYEGGMRIYASNGTDDRSWAMWADAHNPRALRFEYSAARGTNFGSGTAAVTMDYRGLVGIGSDATTPAVALEVDHGGNVDSIARIQYNDDYYLQLTPQTIMMQAANTSSRNLTISTSNAGSPGSGAGKIILDSLHDIDLDAASYVVSMKGTGTEWLKFYNSSSDSYIYAPLQDEDLYLRVNDGGTQINAIFIDSSDLGHVYTHHDLTLNNSGTLNAGNITVAGAQGSDGQVLTSTGSGVAWEDAGGGGASMTDTAVIVWSLIND